jgi:hypothetical protein
MLLAVSKALVGDEVNIVTAKSSEAGATAALYAAAWISF